MINALIEAVSISLNGEFGDGYEIHMEEIKQDLKEPCFFISCINPASSLFLGKRYFRENLFCIQYFPGRQGHERAECNETAERLFKCLEYLEVSGRFVKGTGMKYEVADGILNFFVNYDIYIQKKETLPAMEEVEKELTAKYAGKNKTIGKAGRNEKGGGRTGKAGSGRNQETGEPVF